MAPNPLLDFHDLPAVRPDPPGARRPGHGCLLAESRSRPRGGHGAGLPGRLEGDGLACSTCTTERLSRAWGGRPPQRRGRHARTARRLQRVPARVTEFWTRLGADERLYAKYKAIDPASLNPEQRQALEERHPQLRPRRRRTAGYAKEALRRHPGTAGRAEPEVQRERARRHRRLCLLRLARRTRRRARRHVQAARAAAEAEGKDGYKLTLKMPSYLPVMQFATTAALRERSTAPTSRGPATIRRPASSTTRR
jgi:oligopeptidase A